MGKRMPRNIVRGQKVDSAKVEQARRFRQGMTHEERLLWSALRRNAVAGLHFRRQQVIAGFIVDFYCHAAGLAVEIDGPIHQSRRQYDLGRDEILRNLGVRVLRFESKAAVTDLEDVLKKIRKAAGEET